MKNPLLKIFMLCLTILTITFSACNKKSRGSGDVQKALPKQIKEKPDEAIAAPKLNEAKEIELETRKDANTKESLFSINDDLRAKNEGLFFIGRKNDPGQAVTFAPQVQIVNPEKNKGTFRKIDDPAKFDDFDAEDIKDVPAAQTSDTDWKETNVYLGEFTTRFKENRKAHKTAVLIRVDEWDNNAEKVKLTYKFLSFASE